MELFVPGRVCLLGEHTDWSGAFRRFNRDLEKGYNIVVGTNQGLYARVKKHPSKLVLRCHTNDGETKSTEISMEPQVLLVVAQQGGFWSYAAGVAYKVMTDYHVSGIEIDNYKTTLPLEKGLSSSAAICVLTARAFNMLYGLKLTTRGEMEYAYQGEILTPSQCGRMDQACAFGNQPVLMTYDGEFTGVEKVQLACTLYFVIVDLCAKKDTVEILAALQSAYPRAENEDHRNVHRMLGESNKRIVADACAAMGLADNEEAGERIGALMKEAQELMDNCGGKICPTQLIAPVLHRCLSHPSLQPLIYGGKGVGAGGDGTCQLLCRGEAAQQQVMEIVRSELKMDPLSLILSPGTGVKVGVIPAAGFNPAMFPASKVCKSEMFPIVDRDGICKPLVLHTVEKMIEANLEKVILVIQECDVAQFATLFKEKMPVANYMQLPETHKKYAKKILEIGRSVEFVVQKTQRGLGDAILCAKKHIGDAPFLLALGHHGYQENEGSLGKSCIEQLLCVYRQSQVSAIGLKVTPGDRVSSYGTVHGVPVPEQLANGSEVDVSRVFSVTKMSEKPSHQYATDFLHVQGMQDDEFLCAFGLYVLDPAILDYLEYANEHNITERGMLELTPALDYLRQKKGLLGYIVDGQRFPVGNPDVYKASMAQFA